MRPRQEHHHPVESDREATHRRRPGRQRIEQEREPAPLVLGADPEQPENPLLQLAIGDPDRSAAQLGSVVHGIVVNRPAPARIGLEERKILGMRRGKGMMDEDVLAGRRLGLEERKLHHPQKCVPGRGLETEPPDQGGANQMQSRRGNGVRADHADQDIPLHPGERRDEMRAHRLLPLPFPTGGPALEPDQTARSAVLGGLGQEVEVLPRHVARGWRQDGAEPDPALARRLQERRRVVA